MVLTVYGNEFLVYQILWRPREAEWLRMLIFGALNCLSAYCCGLSLAVVTCETIQVLLVDGQIIFLRDLPFLPHLTIDLAQNK